MKDGEEKFFSFFFFFGGQTKSKNRSFSLNLTLINESHTQTLIKTFFYCQRRQQFVTRFLTVEGIRPARGKSWKMIHYQ